MLICTAGSPPAQHGALRAMFEARKRVFVDLLNWDLAVIDGRYELDQFDDEHAFYLVLTGPDGRHRASARLLDTTRPHILGDLFPALCHQAPPAGDTVKEITRFCLDPRLDAAGRRAARNELISALVDHALANGITTYTGVAEMGWFRQVLAFGWRCRPLGLPQPLNATAVAALAIDVGEETPALLHARGIYPGPLAAQAMRAA